MLAPGQVWAQAATTSLRGSVLDPKGAAIAGAEVTLSNAAIAFSRKATTNATGEYQFVQLPPSIYTLAAIAPGFAPGKVESLVLQVNSPATINLTLAVAGQTTVVEVSAAAPLVNTQDASVGNAFNSHQLINLPSEGRDPVAILSLQPGVVYHGNNIIMQVGRLGLGGQVPDSRGGSVSGARSDQTSITLDGLDNNDQARGFSFEGALRTTLDSLQEFRVTTSNANADQGRSSGAQVNLVTRSGTNTFHGSLYEYHRPTITAANDWFNKHAQLQANLPNRPGKVIRNTFGGSVGGPIRRDRLFFFAAYEGMRRAEFTQVTRTIASEELRQGILQYVCDAADPLCTTANPLVRDVPGVGLVASLAPADVAFMDPGCGLNGSCPLGPGPNPAILAYWHAYPAPNSDTVGDGLNVRGFTFAAPNPEKNDTYIVKLDYKITPEGNHNLFVRGNLQNDRESGPPQFPGLEPNEVTTNNSKAIAAGYTAVLSPQLVNNLRYAFVRQGYGTRGITQGGQLVDVGFVVVDDPVAIFSRSTLVNLPVHNFADDTTWTRGKHALQFGTNWRFIGNNRLSDASNFSYATTQPFWLDVAGVANTGTNLDPAVFGFPAVEAAFESSYDVAVTGLTGILGEVYTNFSQDKTGRVLPNGSLIPRRFKSFAAEFYLQDTWRITPSLTLTGGLRYTLLQPIFESTGNQVCPTFGLNQWFRNRGLGALRGVSDQPTISLDICGNANDRPSYWGWDYRNIGPRLAFAWAPSSSNPILQALFGQGGKGSLRGGYGLYYDHFGHAIADSFDQNGSFGLTTQIANLPVGLPNVACAPRFSAADVLPSGVFCGQNFPPPAPGAFPVTPPAGLNDGFAIYWGMDDGLKTPYAHAFNLSYTRELPASLVLSATYQGRLGRRLLQEVDLAQTLNIVDPTSGMDYFTAASLFSELADNNMPINSVAPIPYWENLFPTAAGPAGAFGCMPGGVANPTATQNFYDLFGCFLHNETLALLIFDVFCFPACLNGQPFRYFDDQFSSLWAWRSQGTSSYHGLRFSVRQPKARGLQFDFNYTFSKSIDIGSNAERINVFAGHGFASQVINAWQPDQLRAPSDFDLRHQVNANWIYELPWGRGRSLGSGWNRVTEALVGGWQVSGLFRWTSGFPFSIVNGPAWATNFAKSGNLFLVGDPGPIGTFIDEGGDPNVFANPSQARSAFHAPHPGQSGQRNNLRGPGYFAVDTGVAKKWKLGESQTLQFSWETFNLTNSVRFDAAQSVGSILSAFSATFGKYSSTLTRPRAMQFALRYSF